MRDGQRMIQPIDFDQPGDLVTGLYDAFVAGNGDDHGPVPSLPWFSYVVSTGGAGGRSEAWVAAEGGRVVGGYALALPEDDNTHVGRLFTLVVRPERRGQRWSGCGPRWTATTWSAGSGRPAPSCCRTWPR
ncbi:GNAT family N-acetyltransferase [Nonomuraea sp. NPDC052129]|uniref:GNAT family N-acetyltransferase n=1 Tax=Nonomuraea sp. NPDC052129 TaxID=3154651 RepID=UPI0034341288